MKKNRLIWLLALLSIGGCALEAPSSFYSFKIVNKTKVFLVVKSMTINEDSIRLDTINPGQELERSIHLFECYVDYKDTLIHHLFPELGISFNNEKIKRDLYKKEEWENNFDIRHGIRGNGIAGELNIVIQQSDLPR